MKNRHCVTEKIVKTSVSLNEFEVLVCFYILCYVIVCEIKIDVNCACLYKN